MRLPISMNSWASLTISCACQFYINPSRRCFPSVPHSGQRCLCHHACISLSISIRFHLHLAPSLPRHHAMVIVHVDGLCSPSPRARAIDSMDACVRLESSLPPPPRANVCSACRGGRPPPSTQTEGREFFLRLHSGGLDVKCEVKSHVGRRWWTRRRRCVRRWRRQQPREWDARVGRARREHVRGRARGSVHEGWRHAPSAG